MFSSKTSALLISIFCVCCKASKGFNESFAFLLGAEDETNLKSIIIPISFLIGIVILLVACRKRIRKCCCSSRNVNEEVYYTPEASAPVHEETNEESYVIMF